jgi:hypothetical protein
MPEIIAQLIASGRAVDLILGFMVVEGLALAAYQRVTGRGIAPASLAANLIAGGSILLALRAMQSGWGPAAIGACLAVSFAAHLADLRSRWRS